MMVASNGFHCMINLSFIKWCLFVVFLFDVFFDYNLLNSFCCFMILIIVFDIYILDLKPMNSVIGIL